MWVDEDGQPQLKCCQQKPSPLFFSGRGSGPVVGGAQWEAAGQSEGCPGREKPADPGQGAWQRSVHDSSLIIRI